MDCQKMIKSYKEIKNFFQKFQEEFKGVKETEKVSQNFWQLKNKIEERKKILAI